MHAKAQQSITIADRAPQLSVSFHKALTLIPLTLHALYTGLEFVLSACPNLMSLSLPSCSRLTGSVLKQLPGSCPTLQRLDLQDCRGVEIELLRPTLSSLGSLRYLGLDGMHSVGDEVVKEAAKLHNLEELSISYTQVRLRVYLRVITLIVLKDALCCKEEARCIPRGCLSQADHILNTCAAENLFVSIFFAKVRH